MSGGWELRARSPREQAPELERWLEEHGADAVTMQDAADDPVLEPGVGETPLWPEVVVTGFFAEDPSALLAGPENQQRWTLHRIAAQAWERTWLDQFQPMDFGHGLWIVPSHAEIPETATTPLYLDPGLAFGTGTHPTTALCLAHLAEHPPRGQRVLDYGCGSGILALAARALGASEVVGVDNDPQALLASGDNASRNGGAAQVRWCLPEDLGQQRFDLIVANILADTLIDLAAHLLDRLDPGGELVLSGILAHQGDAVAQAYIPHVEEVARVQRDEWVLLHLSRP